MSMIVPIEMAIMRESHQLRPKYWVTKTRTDERMATLDGYLSIIRPKKKKGMGAMRAARMNALSGEVNESASSIVKLAIIEDLDGIIIHLE